MARLGRAQLRENSTACHSSRIRLRVEPTRPITCASNDQGRWTRVLQMEAYRITDLCSLHDGGELVFR